MHELPSTENSRRQDIQGLRAVAVILVVLYHAAGFLQGGFIGVDVFFVVSGFVITGLLMRELAAKGGLHFGDFYARRVRRLLPALAFFLLVTVAMSAIVLSPLGTQQTAGSTGRATSLFSANLYLYSSAGGYFDTSSTLNPFLHMWSLAVEEQFYLVFPALIAGVWWFARRRLPQRSTAAVTGVVLAIPAIASLLLSVVLTKRGVSVPGLHEPLRFAFYMSPSRAWEFLAGTFLALFATRLQRLPALVLRAASYGGLLLVLVSAFAYSDRTIFPGVTALMPVIGTSLLLVGGFTRATTVPGLSSRVMVWLGDLSYSWYLWHWPFVVFARQLVNDRVPTLLAASLLSLIPAAISFRYVEQPFRIGARWSGWRAVGLALACVIVPLIGSFSLTYAADRHWGSDAIESVAQQNALHADVLNGCDGAAVGHAGCRWHPSSGEPTGTVVLLGDSNAGHFTEPAIAASNALQMDLVASTLHGCPFADVLLARGTTDGAPCLASVNRVVDQAIALKPQLVLLASASDLYIREAGTMKVPGGAGASDPQGKAAVWGTGLAALSKRFTDAGIPVVIVHPIPHFDSWSLAECSLVTMVRNTNHCGTSAPRATLLERGAAALRAEQGVLGTGTTGTGITGVDFAAELCPHKTCSTNVKDSWIYRDNAHLSVPGSLGLTEAFATAISTALAV